MSLNRYKPHILVLPEDDANRQIANGFLLDPNLNSRAIQVLPPAGGWLKVLDAFTKVHVPEMRQFPNSMIVLVIDFDNSEDRLSHVKGLIPEELKERVFILGVLSEPESLRIDIKKTFEGIGEALAKDCSDNKSEFWGHPLLKHNEEEIRRMILAVKPFLFN